ncbi:MAG: endonuclease MutS2 [Termitinemataceae bacterium]|nr:MAG: endonuclease MutS2 [Termitinemataceae bacterium]
MQQKTYDLLEYNIIMDSVAHFAKSDETKDIIKMCTPLTDPVEVENLKSDVAWIVNHIKNGLHKAQGHKEFDAHASMRAVVDEPHAALPAIKDVLAKLKVCNIVLTIEDAFHLGVFLKNGVAILHWLNKEDNFYPLSFSLSKIKDVMNDCISCENEIFSVIDVGGQIKDTVAISRIKQKIAALNRDLQNITLSYAHNADTKNMLQSDVPSIRDGRTVIALKANFRGRVRGIVHDVSSGGATLFVEPQEIVEKNNELLIEQRNLDEEIRRMLSELSISLNSNYTALKIFYDAIIQIDLRLCRAHYSISIKGVFASNDKTKVMHGNGHDAKNYSVKASTSTAGGSEKTFAKQTFEARGVSPRINILQARHPLLGTRAVPIDICMGDLSLVLITGPNSGGKTVALKTLGLFVLMNQSGLALPAADGTTLPVFNKVFADIGDDQSISNSLSTFSAHIKTIADIIRELDEISYGRTALILFDELCSGTDPAQGSALAMSILDYLLERACRLVVTTHHGALKHYAYARADAQNAAVEFDSATLSPCYRIEMGAPGESRAVDIALRYGLPQSVADGARRLLEGGQSDISQLIGGLTQKLHKARLKEDMLFEWERELREQKRQQDLKDLRLRQKEAEIKDGSLGNLRGLLKESRKTLENLVRKINEQSASGVSHEETAMVKEFLKNLEQTVDAEHEKAEEFVQETKAKKRLQDNLPENGHIPIEIGMEVLAGDLKRRGTVRRAEKKGRWSVEVGSMSITFNEDELVPAPAGSNVGGGTANGGNQICGANITVDYAPQSVPAVMELRLIGMRAADAMDALQKQLDAAVAGGLKTFSVIHGKGDGILQTCVHGFLREQTAVADYYFARPELGGAGRTEVVLH